jgi:hypothetical protein
MGVEMNAQKEEQKKIVLPKEVQIRMMKFFLKTSIPKKKREEQEKTRLSSNTNDGSDK